jgi:hypothetical protein
MPLFDSAVDGVIQGSKFRAPMEPEMLKRRLVARVGGNVECALRLIEYERQRTPGADEVTLIRDALERLDAHRL